MHTTKAAVIALRHVLTLHRPEHGEIIAVGDSIRGSGAGPPQTGPILSNVDDRAATLATNSSHLPALHCQRASDENPTQYSQKKIPRSALHGHSYSVHYSAAKYGFQNFVPYCLPVPP